MFFAAIAAFVMSVSFTSCGGSTSSEEKSSEEKVETTSEEKAESLAPTDKMLSCMEKMVSIMKDTSIKSAEDAQALKEKMEGIQKEVEEISNTLSDEMKNMSEEDVAKYLEKVNDLQAAGQAEAERLEEEAKAIGVELDNL